MNASRSPLRLTGALAVALALAGCASVPDLGPKPQPRAAGDIAATRSFVSATSAWPVDQWWSAYGDPQLAGLIDEGLKNSPDMAAATARFRRAQGLAQQAGAPLLPSIDANGTASVDKQSYNNGIPKEFVPKGWQDRGGASIGANFDLDIWGRNRASLAAATSEARAAEIDAQQARLMLTTGIADLYADLARLHALRDISQQTLDLRSATNKLVADRERNGLDTRGSVRQADATVASARAELSAADEAIALRRNQIAALVGAGPDRGLDIARPQLGALAPRGLPTDVTTDLIGRRPDIAAARERTEAAASRIKVARADFFPAIRLSALIGVQSLGLNNLVESDSTYGSVGPAISLPIFRGGALSGAYRGARGTYDEAVADYDKTVLTAYQEVADALTSQRMLAQRLTDARAAQTAAEDAYNIARQRYEGGLSTYIDVLNVEDRLLVVRQTVAELDARAFALDVALIRALGGGFTTTTAAAFKEDPNG
ncbi:NodT family efflux transporter outer membrane factor (OMF) lipoprotein [Sphingomonas zeicaulis]|uniref:efflux transporter outer membrane subunit n=1 Tax=Sphingomonas zeicaulis TaxID=1632740 RepID=UPI003D1AE97F